MSVPRVPVRTLRPHPDLDQLKRQAKELLAAFRNGAPDAVAEVGAHYRTADAASFTLSQAQLVLARAHGFESWPKLEAFVDGVTMARLAEAVRGNDLPRVRQMLAARPELAHMDMAEHDEHRALHHAVLARSADTVRLLMAHGADPRKGIYPHREATTAVALAADRGYAEIVSILQDEERRRRPEGMQDVPLPSSTIPLPAWEGPITADSEGRALAMLEAHPELVHAAFPADGVTAVHVSASMLWDRALTWLLDRGADVNARAKWGATPLEVAGCGLGADPAKLATITETLLARGAVKTPRWAVATGNAAWLRARHAEGRLENPISEIGGLLRAAVIHGRPEMLTLLLDLGLDPDERVQAGDTQLSGMALQECLRVDRLDMAEILVARGARVTPDVAVALGRSDWLRARHAEGALAGSAAGLLGLAVRHDRPEILTLLLDLGVDPDERGRVGGLEEPLFSWGEPLRECASTGKLKMAGILLERGADPTTQVYAASSALLEAHQRGDREMVALIERYGGVLKASEAGVLGLTDEASRLLVEEASGALPGGAVPEGSTVASELLWSGTDGGHTDIVRLALAHIGWPPGDPRWHGMLMRVLGWHAEPDRARFLECFRLMLERCDPGVRGGTFRATMLHDVSGSWPRRPSGPEERVALATMLLDAGARLDVRDAVLMSTPLGWACRWGRVEMVKLLLERGADAVEAGAEPWATPRAWAEKTQRAGVLALLAGHGG